MQDIHIKQVYDSKGAFSHLELVQGNNVIELSLANSDIDVMPHSYKWGVLQRNINKIVANIPRDLPGSAGALIQQKWEGANNGE